MRLKRVCLQGFGGVRLPPLAALRIRRYRNALEGGIEWPRRRVIPYLSQSVHRTPELSSKGKVVASRYAINAPTYHSLCT